jgi:rhamnose utilization protein RhaD (predicted bifunctional aldolase and dehydrogenase)
LICDLINIFYFQKVFLAFAERIGKKTAMDLTKLIDMSRKYGADENYVLAGGGNTSYKECGVIAVKASGTALGTIDETGFALMDVKKLRDLPSAEYPDSDDEREAAAINDMMSARLTGQGEKRPSVECILHALFEQAYVLHLHPALVNGMTCGARGAEYAATLFGSTAAWVPLTKPGLILSRVCEKIFIEYKAKHCRALDAVFLQNHGIFIAADSTGEIDVKMKSIMDALAMHVLREPDMSPREITNFESGSTTGKAAAFFIKNNKVVYFAANREILSFSKNTESMRPLMKPFTPDHIVYCKAAPLYAEQTGDLAAAYKVFCDSKGYEPRVAVIKDLGAFGIGDNEKAAQTALKVFMDGARIAVYSESFGGPLWLDDDFTDFILNWEIETYRAKKSL